MLSHGRRWLPAVALVSFFSSLAAALSGQEPLGGLDKQRGYNPGEPIPVSCLNRTMYVYSLLLRLRAIPDPETSHQGIMYHVTDYV